MYPRAYPNGMPEPTFKLYLRELSDLDPADVDAACRECMRTDEWFPTVARIRKLATERRLALPSEVEALEQVEQRIAWARLPDDERPDEAPQLHPLVKQSLDLVGGGFAFRSARDPSVIRGQFLRLFRESREASMRSAIVAQAALPAGEPTKQLGRADGEETAGA